MNLILPLLLGGITILIPLAATLWFLRSKIDTVQIFLLRSVQAGGIVAYVYSAGAWSYSSLYLRTVVAILFVAAFLYRLLRSRSLPWSVDRLLPAPLIAGRTLSILAIALLHALQIDGRLYGGPALDLRFPLVSGTYCILQGGRGPLSNPFHFVYGGSRYALDIVRLNRLGNRASGLAPSTVEQYEIFGDTVIAPCDCNVLEALDIHPDRPPGRADRQGGAGNHLILQCGDLEILLAHLQHRSIRVATGESVRQGEALARVGNSGNSAEPHLHIQATRFEKRNQMLEKIPVPITFEGRFLAINDVVRAVPDGKNR